MTKLGIYRLDLALRYEEWFVTIPIKRPHFIAVRRLLIILSVYIA